MRNRIHWTLLGLTLFLLAFGIPGVNHCSAVARIVDFEDIELDPKSDLRAVTDQDGNVLPSGFINSGGVQFLNENAPWGWSHGFAISNRIDTETPGYDPTIGDFGAVVNDSSAFAGSGNDGSENYAVSFGYLDVLDPANIEQLELLPHLVLPPDQQIVAAHFTNTTWAGLSMLKGDDFAKVFGGEAKTDPDFFRLSVYGSRDGTPLAESAELFLADFRSDVPADDFILSEWKRLDLTNLSAADRLYFNLDSSDVGGFGMNTPALFAMDDIELRDAIALVGDFSGNGQVDASDLDRLCSETLLGMAADVQFDLDGDGSVGHGDVELLLSTAKVLPGDVDFDGEVSFADFLVVSDAFGQVSTWSRGDFDCDGATQFSDFLILSANFGQSFIGEAQSVPEPSSMLSVGVGLISLSWLVRRRNTA